ncbi:HVO_A0556 family zinc finger protein [Natrarchaeobius oligotrophus]|uniref:HVO_A0556 family zinc finger protein n=1 Tax=Natrarchaeobius oligotrophus TaxID=3455743 RepID=UPI001404E922|nr:HVO_A0556 family zinc finger protein [Natrarchaeobius chitinivorans]
MAKSQQSGGQHGQLLAILEGRSCPSCDDGELERGTYKDNEAVICDDCGTPRAQVWRVP